MKKEEKIESLTRQEREEIKTNDFVAREILANKSFKNNNLQKQQKRELKEEREQRIKNIAFAKQSKRNMQNKRDKEDEKIRETYYKQLSEKFQAFIMGDVNALDM